MKPIEEMSDQEIGTKVIIKGYEVIIDDEFKEYVISLNWNARESKNGRGIYFTNSVMRNGKTIKTMLHRKITNCPRGLIVDHINGNTLDNRKNNLRICNLSESAKNRIQSVGKTGIPGIWIGKDGWYRARVDSNTKTYHIGRFFNMKTAFDALVHAVNEKHGEFSRFKHRPYLLNIDFSKYPDAPLTDNHQRVLKLAAANKDGLIETTKVGDHPIFMSLDTMGFLINVGGNLFSITPKGKNYLKTLLPWQESIYKPKVNVKNGGKDERTSAG